MPVVQSPAVAGTEAQAEIAAEFLRRAGSYPIFAYEPIVCNQKKFHESQAKERWIFGPNKIGKSEMGAAEVVMILLHIHPVHKRPGPQRALIISEDYETSMLVTQPRIFQFLPLQSPDITGWNRQTHHLQLADGGYAQFSSFDRQPRKFEDSDWDVIWCDGEPPRDIYISLIRGCVARGALFLATMTPFRGLTWSTREILPHPQEDLAIFTGEGWSIYDNPYLSKEEIERFASHLTDAEKAARLYGKAVPLGGTPVFDFSQLVKLREATLEPERAVLVLNEEDKVEVLANPEGPLRIWKHPQPFHRYIIFADCAGGSPTGKFQAAVVLDRDAFEIAAIYHCREHPREYGKSLDLLGRIYNQALLAIEINPGGSGGVVLEAARDYSNLYYRQVRDEESLRDTKKVGWWTTSANRHLLIAGCHTALKDGLGIYSQEIIEDFSNFIYVEGGGQEAQEGTFDDLVIATGGAMQLHRETYLRPLKEVIDEDERAHQKDPFDGYKPFPAKPTGIPTWLVGR